MADAPATEFRDDGATPPGASGTADRAVVSRPAGALAELDRRRGLAAGAGTGGPVRRTYHGGRSAAGRRVPTGAAGTPRREPTPPAVGSEDGTAGPRGLAGERAPRGAGR